MDHITLEAMVACGEAAQHSTRYSLETYQRKWLSVDFWKKERRGLEGIAGREEKMQLCKEWLI